MKKFMLGFVLAAVLFSALPVSAAIKEYILTPSTAKLVVDGMEIKDESLPVLYLDPGYNYIPAATFRSICDKIGVEFKWDNAVNEIQISTKPATSTTTDSINTGGNIMSEVQLNKYGLPDLSNYTGTKPVIEEDGVNKFFTYEGVKYICIVTRPDQPRIIPAPYYIQCPVVDGKVSYILQLVKKTQSDSTVLINEIPYALYHDKRDFCLEYDYYLNNILPIINQGAI